MSRAVVGATAAASVAERRGDILRALHASGRVEVGELALRLGVAEETVRRDLRALEQAGSLRRAHGGAIPNEIEARHPDAGADGSDDGSLHAQAVEALARAVVGGIVGGDTVYLDGGAVPEAVAGMLRGVRIVTASLPVALAAASVSDPPEVQLLGGQVGGDGRASGQWARELAAGLRPDVAVLVADGLGAGGRMLAATVDGAALSAAVVASARRVVLVGGPELLGEGGRGVVAFAPLSAVDQVVLGASATPELAALLADAGVEVVLAAPADGADSAPSTPSTHRTTVAREATA